MTKFEVSFSPANKAVAALSHQAQKHIVNGGHGGAFSVEKGTSFRIIDLHGRQIVDMMAWVSPPHSRPDSALASFSLSHRPGSYAATGEHLSMSYSRYVLGRNNGGPAVGDCLVTNKQSPIFKLTADTCHTHDMTFMACNPAFYTALGQPGHRNCAENVFEAMKPWGMQNYLEAASVDPFNIFQNTPDMALKDLGCSRPGDYVEFEVLKDALVGVSACPYDVVSGHLFSLSTSRNE